MDRYMLVMHARLRREVDRDYFAADSIWTDI